MNILNLITVSLLVIAMVILWYILFNKISKTQNIVPILFTGFFLYFINLFVANYISINLSSRFEIHRSVISSITLLLTFYLFIIMKRKKHNNYSKYLCIAASYSFFYSFQDIRILLTYFVTGIQTLVSNGTGIDGISATQEQVISVISDSSLIEYFAIILNSVDSIIFSVSILSLIYFLRKKYDSIVYVYLYFTLSIIFYYSLNLIISTLPINRLLSFFMSQLLLIIFFIKTTLSNKVKRTLLLEALNELII